MSEQLKLGEDSGKKKAEMHKRKGDEETWRKQKEADETEFKKYFKEGATRVFRIGGKIYFWGDVSHCGRESIFHNAKELRNRMLQQGANYANMNCNDLPTFEKVYTQTEWDKDNKQRIDLYKDDLYSFDGDEIVIEDLIGDEEQKQRYCLDNVSTLDEDGDIELCSPVPDMEEDNGEADETK